MMPVPTHLKDFVVPNSSLIDEEPLEAKVRCTCGGKAFQLLYPGQTRTFEDGKFPVVAEIGNTFFFLIKAKCMDCEKEHLLLDMDFHGWNGFVCHDPQKAALPRPNLVAWKCEACGELAHKAEVIIHTEGKNDFVEETGGEFDSERWPDGFGWFTLKIECTKCGKKSPEWVTYETM
jgi:hypothetical protein